LLDYLGLGRQEQDYGDPYADQRQDQRAGLRRAQSQRDLEAALAQGGSIMGAFGQGGIPGSAPRAEMFERERAAQRAALRQRYEQTQRQRYGDTYRPRVDPDDPFRADRAHTRQELSLQDQERNMVSPGTPSKLDEILNGLTREPEPTPKWLDDLLADRLWRKPQKDPDDRSRRGWEY
jgi:hypothetical protein